MRLFSAHIQHLLSAFCHGELSGEDTRRVAAHLETCARCRMEYEAIRKGDEAVQYLPARSAPDSLWDRIETELHRTGTVKNSSREPAIIRPAEGNARKPDHVRGTLGAKRPRGGSWIGPTFAVRRRLAMAGAFLFCVIGAVTIWKWKHPPRVEVTPPVPSWEVARVVGTPRIGSQSVHGSGRLAVGQWLYTDGNSKAEIEVADIGHVRVEPNSEVQLAETGKKQHRLVLGQGELFAKVIAPPKLFLVDTPAARAVDLGCSYTLRVDGANITYLHVKTGKVVLERNGQDVEVPAGASCETRPVSGTGTPCFTDAPDRLRAALEKYDFESGGAEQLQIVLDSARPIDTLPLFYLLSRVPESDRGRVYDRLAALAPPPHGVTRSGILQLDPKMLALWINELENDWIAVTRGSGSFLFSN
jgi:hypothetical protein